MEYVMDLPQVKPEEVADLLKSQPKVYDFYVDKEIPMFRPVEGTNRVRILPYPPIPEQYQDQIYNGLLGLKVFIHGFLTNGADSYLCNKMMKEELCPFCEVFDRYRNVNWDTAKWYQPKPRILVWVYDLTERKDKQGNVSQPQVKLWAAPISLIENILEIAYDEDEKAYLPLLHLKDGYLVSFKMSKNSKGFYEYSAVKLVKPYSVDKEKLEGVIKPWEDILVFYDYDYMKDKMVVKLDENSGGVSESSSKEVEESVGVSEDADDLIDDDLPF